MVWARNNIAVILTVVGLIAAMAVQWSNFQRTVLLAEQVDERLRDHELDSTRHVDRYRDEQRYQELIRRLDRIEVRLNGN